DETLVCEGSQRAIAAAGPAPSSDGDTPATAPVTRSAAPRVSKRVEVSHAPIETPRRTSINFIRTDIADIVNTLSIQQSVNIALPPRAKGQVTVSLRDVTVEEAVRLISRLAGLDYLFNGDTYVIGTPEELQAMAGRAGTGQIQPLHYLSQQDARELLAGT